MRHAASVAEANKLDPNLASPRKRIVTLGSWTLANGGDGFDTVVFAADTGDPRGRYSLVRKMIIERDGNFDNLQGL